MNYELRRYTRDCILTDYLPIPRKILEMDLASTAVLLYGLLLDRATLSRKHGYWSPDGWIYAVFPNQELCEKLNISPTMVKTHLRQLENHGLIRRVRRSRKEANRFYMLVPFDALKDTGTATFPTPESRKTVLHRETKLPPNNNRKQQDIINAYRYAKEESL